MFNLKLLCVFMALWMSIELLWQMKYANAYFRPYGLLWAAAVTGCIALFLM